VKVYFIMKSVTTDETATVDRSTTGLAARIGDTAAWQEPTRPADQPRPRITLRRDQ
jgi:hypothetical protein